MTLTTSLPAPSQTLNSRALSVSGCSSTSWATGPVAGGGRAGQRLGGSGVRGGPLDRLRYQRLTARPADEDDVIDVAQMKSRTLARPGQCHMTAVDGAVHLVADEAVEGGAVQGQ